MIHAGLLRLETRGDGDVVDLTAGVARVVATSGAEVAVATVFVVGATAAVTTIEYEPGALEDLRTVLDQIAPKGAGWAHDRLNDDTNGHAHLRAALIGPSVSIPVTGGELALGTWQQVVLCDFDDGPRRREVHVHVVS
jgi:secondary thiamine-phosphate synthase enzyme